MTDKKEKSLSPGLSVGGLSAVSIGVANIFAPPEYTALVTTAIPVVVGGIVWSIEYLLLALNAPSIDELRLTRQLDRQIKYLRKQIKEAKSGQMKQAHIDTLEEQLQNHILARSKASALFKQGENSA